MTAPGPKGSGMLPKITKEDNKLTPIALQNMESMSTLSLVANLCNTYFCYGEKNSVERLKKKNSCHYFYIYFFMLFESFFIAFSMEFSGSMILCSPQKSTSVKS